MEGNSGRWPKDMSRSGGIWSRDVNSGTEKDFKVARHYVRHNPPKPMKAYKSRYHHNYYKSKKEETKEMLTQQKE